VTSEELELLRDHATEIGDGRWSFTGYPHDSAAALAIIRACLILDVPVTDTITSGAWLKLVAKVANLESKVNGSHEQRPLEWP
jgi:hypothetical protein